MYMPATYMCSLFGHKPTNDKVRNGQGCTRSQLSAECAQSDGGKYGQDMGRNESEKRDRLHTALFEGLSAAESDYKPLPSSGIKQRHAVITIAIATGGHDETVHNREDTN